MTPNILKLTLCSGHLQWNYTKNFFVGFDGIIIQRETDMRLKMILCVLALTMPITAADEVEDLILDLTYGTPSTICDAARALGDIGDPRAVDPLIGILNTLEDCYYQRCCVIEALGKIGDPRAIDPLVQILNTTRVYETRVAVTQALGEIGGIEAINALIRAFPSYDSRNSAKDALIRIGGPAVEPLTGLLEHENEQTRIDAARALGEIGDPRAVGSLVEALNDSEQGVRFAAALALIKIEGSSSDSLVDALKNMQNDTEPYLPLSYDLRFYESCGAPPFTKKSEWLLEDLAYNAETAFGVLIKMGDFAVEPLIRALGAGFCPYQCDTPYKKYAALALGEIGDSRAVNPLIEALKNDYDDNRQAAAWALGEIGDERAIEPLAYVAKNDKDLSVREAAAEALEKIGTESEGGE